MVREQRAITILAAIIMVAAGIGAAYLFLGTDIPFSDAERLRGWVMGYGMLAPVMLMVVQVIQVVIAPLPNQVSAIVAGFLFGTGLGTLYTTIGTILGSYIAFLLGRAVGRPLVLKLASEERIQQFDELTAEHGAIAFLTMFLIPAFPGDLLCYIGGMSKMRGRVFLAVALMGRGPKFLLYSVIGHRLATGGVPATLPYLMPLVVLAAVTFWKRDQLERVLDRVDSLGRQFYA